MHETTDDARERASMIQSQLRQRGVQAAAVLRAMQNVPREAFVPIEERAYAYADCALPLGHGQTISQPYMVARAAELADLKPNDRVLEVGLGSGYQAAVLAQLCEHVTGIEIVPELAERAEHTLGQLGIENVSVRLGDGSLGYAPDAPYDAIVVAAAAPRVPAQLIAQLKPGGRLVIPVGSAARQTLSVITKTVEGSVTSRYDPCVYVPLRGEAGHH
jgi:protein-L-isoaspartate(D-aspartate) O-methyltransferase